MFNLRRICKRMNMNEVVSEWKRLRYNAVTEDEIVKSLVLPILEKAGWNIADSSKEVMISRPTASDVDIKIFFRGKMIIGIECKALDSDEFFVNVKRGALEHDYTNKPKDAVGQLRAYSLRYCLNDELNDDYKPVLTNGYRWIIFNKEWFLYEKSIFETITEKLIIFDKTIVEPDFLSEIKKHIKKPK